MRFSEAQDLVMASSEVHDAFPDGFVVADYGWQSATEFLLVVEPDGEGVGMDLPAVYVHKFTGNVRLEYGLMGTAADGMSAIGVVP